METKETDNKGETMKTSQEILPEGERIFALSNKNETRYRYHLALESSELRVSALDHHIELSKLQIEEQQKEMERLKGLIEKGIQFGWRNGFDSSTGHNSGLEEEEAIDYFKKQHNIE